MEPPQHTLGSILADLVGDEAERTAYRADPEAFLAERGFPDIPDRLMGEAVCHVADSLPAPIAEQLAPEVMALSPLTTAEWAEGTSGGVDALGALATVPAHDLVEFDSDVQGDVDVDDLADVSQLDPQQAIDAEDLDADEDDPDQGVGDSASPEADLEFGAGTRSDDADDVDFEEIPELDDVNGLGFGPDPDHLDTIDAVPAASIDEGSIDTGTDIEESSAPVAPSAEPAEPDADWDFDVE
jgi:hypothetical protein